jgi:serine O-acetyltransferase
MLTSLTTPALTSYLGAQLGHFFPDGGALDLERVVPEAMERVEECWKPARLPMYRRGAEPYFSHLHSDHYAAFVYIASNVAFGRGDMDLASKLYCLNKALNGFMCMYDTVLPPHFLVVHTVGMLLGKATYGDYFVAIHDVTIGTDRGKKPALGRGVVMYGGSSIVGDCVIGDNVSVAAHALVRNEPVPAGHVVAGTSPHLTMKPAARVLIEEFFDTGAER